MFRTRIPVRVEFVDARVASMKRSEIEGTDARKK